MKFTHVAVLFVTATVAVASRSSPDATCGAKKAYTCHGSAFGNCCSQYGWCGRTQAHCGTGCQKGFGTCVSTSSPKPVSKDARCGSDHRGQTCEGSLWGNCCSRYGYCGGTSAYCGNGCQSGFGDCSGVKSTSRSSSSIRSTPTQRSTSRSSSSSTRTSSPRPSPTQPVSKNARCGKLFGGQTCLNSRWGDCCSKWSYCGSTKDYCAPGNCQKGYGLCGAIESSSARTSALKTSSSSTKTSTVSSTGISTSSTTTLLSTSTISSSTVPSTSVSTLSISSTSISSASISSASISSASISSASISGTTIATITGSSSTTTSSASTTSPSAPVCTSVFDCPSFEGPITGSCGASNGKCQDNWQVFCSLSPQSNQGFISEQSVEGGDECLALCDANPECLAAVYSGNSPLGISCAMYRRIGTMTTSFRSTYFKVCSDPGSSISSSSSTTSTSTGTISASTSTITTGTLSSISSSTSVSSTSAPPACTSNLVANGEFDTGSLDPWRVGNSNRFPRVHVVDKNDVLPSPHAGPFFLVLNSTAYGSANLNQQLIGVKAGTYRCSGFYNIPGDLRNNETPVTLTFGLNGAFCGSITSTLSNGWTQLVSDDVVVEEDDPYFSINVMFNDGLAMNIGVDSVFVRPVEDLPGFCPNDPPAGTPSLSQVSSTTATSVPATDTAQSTPDTPTPTPTLTPTPTPTPSSPPICINYVSNGGFENYMGGPWSYSDRRGTIVGTNTGFGASDTGEYFLKIPAPYTGSVYRISQTVSVPASRLRCSGRYRTGPSTGTSYQIVMYLNDNICGQSDVFNEPTEWTDIGTLTDWTSLRQEEVEFSLIIYTIVDSGLPIVYLDSLAVYKVDATPPFDDSCSTPTTPPLPTISEP